MNVLETHISAIQECQQRSEINAIELLRTINIHVEAICNIASDLFDLTRYSHASFPNTLKTVIINSVKPLQEEMQRRFEMLPEVREDLQRKTQRLYAEQSYISRITASTLNEHLSKLKQWFAQIGNSTPQCYISYAWPTQKLQEKEYWVQPFLKVLYDHLTAAGVKVIMDFRDCKAGTYITQFTQQLHHGNPIIFVGTESLLQQCNNSTPNNTQTEISIIRNRFPQDQRQFGESRIYPLLISGSIKTAYPPPLCLPPYSEEVKDARNGSYLHMLKELIAWIFKAPISQLQNKEHYEQMWQEYCQRYPGLPENPTSIAEELALGYHAHYLANLKRTLAYQCVQAQQVNHFNPNIAEKMISLLEAESGITAENIFQDQGSQFQRPPMTQNFIKRTTLFKQINDYFSSPNIISTLTLYGPSGIGKTVIAQYRYFYPPIPYALRAWFDVEAGRELLYRQYIQLAEENNFMLPSDMSDE